MPTEQRINKLRRVAQSRQAGLTVVIEDVFDPHNLGAISRSCDAFGIQQINVIFETHPEFDPKEVGKNSSTATNKWLEYRIHRGTETALRTLKQEGWELVAAALDTKAESIFEADLCHSQVALLFGNEKTGLSSTALSLADRLVTIPMRGIAQSVNVSVSAALCIYEVTRQRMARCPEHLSMAPEQVARTLDYFVEMHEQFGKRNKRLRVGRAKERLSKLPNPKM
ncbi:MAG: RNA methyltransferase [Chloroflexi bacterium]|nr:RNA methyltransferase [Chloroflexota bacterium]